MPPPKPDCRYCIPVWNITALFLRVKRKLRVTPNDPHNEPPVASPWWPLWPGSGIPTSIPIEIPPLTWTLPGGLTFDMIIHLPLPGPQPPDFYQPGTSKYIVDIYLTACLEDLKCGGGPDSPPDFSLPDFGLPKPTEWWLRGLPTHVPPPRPQPSTLPIRPRLLGEEAAPSPNMYLLHTVDNLNPTPQRLAFSTWFGGDDHPRTSMKPIRFTGKPDWRQPKVCCKPGYPPGAPASVPPGYATPPFPNCCQSKKDLICNCAQAAGAADDLCCIDLVLKDALTIPGMYSPPFIDSIGPLDWPEEWHPRNWTFTWPGGADFLTDEGGAGPHIQEFVDDVLPGMIATVLPTPQELGIGLPGALTMDILLGNQPFTVNIQTPWGIGTINIPGGQLLSSHAWEMENLVPGGHARTINERYKEQIKKIIDDELTKISGRGVGSDACTGASEDNGDIFNPPSPGTSDPEHPTQPLPGSTAPYDWVSKCRCTSQYPLAQDVCPPRTP